MLIIRVDFQSLLGTSEASTTIFRKGKWWRQSLRSSSCSSLKIYVFFSYFSHIFLIFFRKGKWWRKSLWSASCSSFAFTQVNLAEGATQGWKMINEKRKGKTQLISMNFFPEIQNIDVFFIRWHTFWLFVQFGHLTLWFLQVHQKKAKQTIS